jgi:subtilisin family serine protease
VADPYVCVPGSDSVLLAGPTDVADDPGTTNAANGLDLPFSVPALTSVCLVATVVDDRVLFGKVTLDGSLLLDEKRLVPGTTVRLPVLVAAGAHVLNARFKSQHDGSLRVEVSGKSPVGPGTAAPDKLKLSVGGLADSPDPISPRNHDSAFDRSVLSAEAFVRLMDDQPATIRYAFDVIDPVTCLPIRTLSAEATVPSGGGQARVPLSQDWDGKDRDGSFVADNDYLYSVTATLVPAGGGPQETAHSYFQKVRVDNTPPRVLITSTVPSDVMVPNTSITLEGTIEDDSLVNSASLTVAADGLPPTTQSLALSPDGRFSVAIALRADPGKTFTINRLSVSASDLVANSFTVEKVVIVAQRYWVNEVFVKLAAGVQPESVNAPIGATMKLQLDAALGWFVMELPPTVTLAEGLIHYDTSPGVIGESPVPVTRVNAVVPNDPVWPAVRPAWDVEATAPALRNARFAASNPTTPCPENPDFGKSCSASSHCSSGICDSGTCAGCLPGAWDYLADRGIAPYTTSGAVQQVKVAVLDTGCDENHPDLIPNLDLSIDGTLRWFNPLPYENSTQGPSPMDSDGHGTGVIGVIAAAGNNGIGVTGGAWNVKALNLRTSVIANIDNNVLISSVNDPAGGIQAIKLAKVAGARVVNISWGLAVEDAGASILNLLWPYPDIFDNFENDMVFVIAAGNATTDNDRHANFPAPKQGGQNVITVGATDASDALAGFSNFGARTVQLAAPGTEDQLVTTFVTHHVPIDNRHTNWRFGTAAGGSGGNGDYGQFSGTSAAAPMVSACAALILQLHPDFKPYQVRAAIQRGVDRIPGLAGKVEWGGRLNCYEALRASDTLFPTVSIVQEQRVAPNDVLTLEFSHDGSLLAMGTRGQALGNDAQVVVIERAALEAGSIPNEAVVFRRKFGDHSVNRVAWSRDDRRLAVACDDGHLYLLDATSSGFPELASFTSPGIFPIRDASWGPAGPASEDLFFITKNEPSIFRANANGTVSTVASAVMARLQPECLAVSSSIAAVGTGNDSFAYWPRLFEPLLSVSTASIGNQTACALSPVTGEIVLGTARDRLSGPAEVLFFDPWDTSTESRPRISLEYTSLLQLANHVDKLAWTTDGEFLGVVTETFLGLFWVGDHSYAPITVYSDVHGDPFPDVQRSRSLAFSTPASLPGGGTRTLLVVGYADDLVAPRPNLRVLTLDFR